MRLFPLLPLCLLLSLPAPLFAYTTHRTTVGPLSMHFGTPERLSKQEKITELDTPLELTAKLENKGDTDLPVKLTFRTIETFAFSYPTGNAPPSREHSISGTIKAKGTMEMVVNVIAQKGTYTAQYPVRLDAEFELDGEKVNAHIIQVIRTELFDVSTPKNPLRGKIIADPSQLPLNTLPSRGGLALATLDTYRGVWNHDNQPEQILPVGFQGNVGISAASISRQSMDRGGVARQSIGMHPPYRGGVGNVGVQYRVKLPETKPIALSFFTAMRDTFPPEPPSDGVTYRIKVDGKTVYEKHDAEKTWVAHEADLSEFAGKEILLTLESDPGPRRNTVCDSCFWGDVILFAGEKPQTLSAEEKQKMFAENLQAIKMATSESPKTHVFNLDGGLVGAVTFGNNGFIDGVIGVGNAEKQVQFDGLRVWVKGQLIGASPSTLDIGQWEQWEKTRYKTHWQQRIKFADNEVVLAFDLRQYGPALQLAVRSFEPFYVRLSSNTGKETYEVRDDIIDRIEFGPATHHAERVYFGHGYCIVEPESFTVDADGHRLSTSHVGMDFENGLSVLQATSFPPDRFIVDPAAKRYTLSVHPSTVITLLPGTSGALDCAIRFRPLHEGKPAPDFATKAGRFVFDIWGGRYQEHHRIIENAAKYGLTDSMLTVHNWQHYGYDDRLPDIWPPNPRLGTLEEMQATLKLCDSLGILYGLHDNYIDIYPDADEYSFDETTFTSAGQPRPAWNNYGIEAQSYQFRPDRIQRLVERNINLIAAELPVSAYFIDVFTSLPPVDYYDRDGNFHSRAETRRLWGEAFETIRERLSEANKNFPHAVMTSESGLDSLIGYIGGADCNFMYISSEPGEFRIPIKCKEWSRVPWFDAVHHTKFSLHGAGYSSRYEAQRGRDIHGIESDDYIVSEMLTGHALMVDNGSSRRGAVRKYWLAQDLIRHLADKNITQVEFVDGNIQRQKITWSDRDGSEAVRVYVNLDEQNDWAVSDEWTTPPFVLPQYGYLGAFRSGYSAIHRENGRVVESSHTIRHDERNNMIFTNYSNARQKGVENLLPITPTLNSFQYLGENRFTATFKWDAKDTIPKDLCIFVHCVERQRAWHHRPNEAVLGGGFPATPTSQWNGAIITDNNATMSIPDDLPAGRYYLVVGLYDANGRWQRSKLIGFNTGGDRYAVGWLNVQRREGAVSNITLEPLTWDDAKLCERLLPPKEAVVTQGGTVKSKGGFRVVGEIAKRTMTLTPLPDEPATEIALIAFGGIVKSVKAIDETGKELRDVPFSYKEGEQYPFTFTTHPGEFAYKIEW